MCLVVLGAAGNAAADTITLGWDQSSSTVGYKVHIGAQSGSYSQHVDVGSATTYAFTSATAGQQYCFAVSAYVLSTRVEGPNSSEVCGYSNAPPTLVNPGARQSTVGQPTSLQLQGSDPQSQPLTYSATGLPTGLSIMASTGYISGTGTTAGTYNVTARASDGVLTASQTFTWTMTTSTGGSTPPSTGTWTVCANEGGTCSFAGTQQVRYGANGLYAYKTLTGGTPCTNAVFGDPAPNVAKQCAIGGTSSTGSGGTTTDTTVPTVSISTPTTGSTYSTTQSTINITGTASDDRGLSQVTWVNSLGGSGVASGTTSWSIASIPLQVGTNVITVTAVDSSGNRATDSLSVTRSSTTSSGSTSCPTASTVSICTPTTGTSFTTTQSSINMTGTAPSVIVRVVWENVANGARGVASGTTSWSIANIPLVVGSNLIEVTAYDSAGNPSVDRLLVTR